MTQETPQENTPDPGPGGQVAVLVGAQVAKGPDGSPWVALTVQIGLVSVNYLMDPETAVQVGPLITERVAIESARAVRMRSGLVVQGDPGWNPAHTPNGGGTLLGPGGVPLQRNP